MSGLTFAQVVSQEARLVILRLLSEAPNYEINSSILQTTLQDFALNLSRDSVHTELAWLQEQQLVTLRQIATVQIATITTRGLDVAQGRAHCPGVKRPGPKG